MRYREVIHAPLWLLALVYFFSLSLVISIWAALGNNPALVTFAISTICVIALYFKTALIIEVDQNELRVGPAHIAHQYIGQIEMLDNQDFRRVRTRDADPAAFLAIRFWSTKAIQLIVDDERDATPYWLISTARGAELLKALKV